MNWFVRMCIFIAIVFVDFWLATLLEKYNTQIMNAIKKIFYFIIEVAEDALLVILALLTH